MAIMVVLTAKVCVVEESDALVARSKICMKGSPTVVARRIMTLKKYIYKKSWFGQKVLLRSIPYL